MAEHDDPALMDSALKPRMWPRRRPEGS
jgi:hypothetical protein